MRNELRTYDTGMVVPHCLEPASEDYGARPVRFNDSALYSQATETLLCLREVELWATSNDGIVEVMQGRSRCHWRESPSHGRVKCRPRHARDTNEKRAPLKTRRPH